MTDDITDTVWGWISITIAAVIAVAAALIITFVVVQVLRLLGRRRDSLAQLAARVRNPLLILTLAIGLRSAALATVPDDAIGGPIRYVLMLAMIAAAGWMIGALLLFFVDLLIRSQAADDPAAHGARRRRTQILIMRRLVIVIVAVLSVGAMALTIPGAEAFGTSLLASAGLASLVAGIAAQSTLGNFFAGLQLAFSDALRVGDTVVVEGEYGRVEELTLTYVVVQIWDDRRLVLPSTYFTTTPYANWTRSQTAITGTVLLDVDWTVDVDALRARLDEILEGTELWDGRAKGVVMVDSSDQTAKVRISVTASDANRLWDLQCLVREKLVRYLAVERPSELGSRRLRLAENGRIVAGAAPVGAGAPSVG